ncbi:cytochrome P450 71AU50-like [Cornus florida]|uniref:cytochrome P450 71AU50-like n=1 Tax=Cornus florida TaxID=4283 RepID=UPI002896EEFD|nr:cytochrome P450 71AU50-like [Cornus florida]
MASPWTMFALVAPAAYILQAIWFTIRKNKNGRRLPLGPKGLPILGHLRMIAKFPHRDLHLLAKKYGPIIVPKLCTLELFSSIKISSFESMRREEFRFLIKSIKEAAQDRGGVDLSAKVSSMNAEMTCQMMFGKKYTDRDLDDRGFKAMMEEGMHLGIAPNQGRREGDCIGDLRLFSKVFDEFFEKFIDEHVQARDQGQTKDFVDIMLTHKGSEEADYLKGRSGVKAPMLGKPCATDYEVLIVRLWLFEESNCGTYKNTTQTNPLRQAPLRNLPPPPSAVFLRCLSRFQALASPLPPPSAAGDRFDFLIFLHLPLSLPISLFPLSPLPLETNSPSLHRLFLP